MLSRAISFFGFGIAGSIKSSTQQKSAPLSDCNLETDHDSPKKRHPTRLRFNPTQAAQHIQSIWGKPFA